MSNKSILLALFFLAISINTAFCQETFEYDYPKLLINEEKAYRSTSSNLHIYNITTGEEIKTISLKLTDETPCIYCNSQDYDHHYYLGGRFNGQILNKINKIILPRGENLLIVDTEKDELESVKNFTSTIFDFAINENSGQVWTLHRNIKGITYRTSKDIKDSTVENIKIRDEFSKIINPDKIFYHSNKNELILISQSKENKNKTIIYYINPTNNKILRKKTLPISTKYRDIEFGIIDISSFNFNPELELIYAYDNFKKKLISIDLNKNIYNVKLLQNIDKDGVFIGNFNYDSNYNQNQIEFNNTLSESYITFSGGNILVLDTKTRNVKDLILGQGGIIGSNNKELFYLDSANTIKPLGRKKDDFITYTSGIKDSFELFKGVYKNYLNIKDLKGSPVLTDELINNTDSALQSTDANYCHKTLKSLKSTLPYKLSDFTTYGYYDYCNPDIDHNEGDLSTESCKKFFTANRYLSDFSSGVFFDINENMIFDVCEK